MRFGFLILFLSSVASAGPFQSVNLNVASKEQMMVLPGVGEKLAQRIVDHRSEKGLFASLDDLLLIKGVRPKLLSDLAGKIELSRVKKNADPKIATPLPARTEAEIQALIETLDDEPKMREVQDQAIKYAMAEPARAEEWLRRARLAPALPSLVVSTGKGIDSNASMRERIGDTSVLQRRDSSDFNLNVKLEWKFQELLFNKNELYVAREGFRMALTRERILHDVLKSYVERRKAQIRMLTSETLSPVERAETKLYIEELSSVLDGLTGGWFGEKIAKL